MPLLFAIAGLVALGLAFLVLVAPVLLVVGLIRALRTRPLRNSVTPAASMGLHSVSPIDDRFTDVAFTELVGREWPQNGASLRRPYA
jgi:hypothetical protein